MLSVDGKAVANKKIPHTIPFIITIDETFHVGIDLRTPVDNKDYQVPFRFTGTLAKLTVKLGPEQLMAEDREKRSPRPTTSLAINSRAVRIPWRRQL